MHISLTQACQKLQDGEVVALPTETVYGLAASLRHPQAVEQIFKLKGRPANNPLIVHLASGDELSSFVQQPPPKAAALIETFWPGPLTLILPILDHTISQIARAGLPTAAFRVPQHPLTLEVIKLCGPLVMPSANLSGSPSSTRPEHVEEDFGLDFPVLDGGACSKGLESTILLYRNECWEIVRLGALQAESLAPILGYIPQVTCNQKGETPVCPGQLYRHYSPQAKLKMVETFPADATGIVLGFADRRYPSQMQVWPLGQMTDPEQVAEQLYDILRRLDEKGVTTAWVDGNMPQGGLWDTIRERLTKAATS